MLRYIKKLFAKKPLRELKIRPVIKMGVRISELPTKTQWKHQKHQYVYATKQMHLKLIKETNNYYYFKVFMPFVEKQFEAPDQSIVYIKKTAFKEANYRIIN